ncbi:hypothetical protein ACWC2H_04470 [Streptomyces sp. 900105755]
MCSFGALGAEKQLSTVLLDDGENIKALAGYLGHSDPGLNLRVYAHLMPSNQERKIRSVKVGRNRRILPAWIDEYVNRCAADAEGWAA